MANNIPRRVQASEPGIVLAGGKLTLSPAADVGTTACTIRFASGSMLSAGLYRVQFSSPFVDVRSATHAIANTGSADYNVTISGSANNSTGRYLDFYLRSGGTATVPSNPVDVHWQFMLKTSGV